MKHATRPKRTCPKTYSTHSQFLRGKTVLRHSCGLFLLHHREPRRPVLAQRSHADVTYVAGPRGPPHSDNHLSIMAINCPAERCPLSPKVPSPAALLVDRLHAMPCSKLAHSRPSVGALHSRRAAGLAEKALPLPGAVETTGRQISPSLLPPLPESDPPPTESHESDPQRRPRLPGPSVSFPLPQQLLPTPPCKRLWQSRLREGPHERGSE